MFFCRKKMISLNLIKPNEPTDSKLKLLKKYIYLTFSQVMVALYKFLVVVVVVIHIRPRPQPNNKQLKRIQI